jgi:hypothetical protein
VSGDPVARPPVGGDGERLLGGFLGEIEVAEEADQGGQDAAPFLPEDLLVAVRRTASPEIDQPARESPGRFPAGLVTRAMEVPRAGAR